MCVLVLFYVSFFKFVLFFVRIYYRFVVCVVVAVAVCWYMLFVFAASLRCVRIDASNWFVHV